MRIFKLFLLAAVVLLCGSVLMAQPEIEMMSKDTRTLAAEMINNGKAKEAYAIFYQYVMNPDEDAAYLSNDLRNLFRCIQNYQPKKIDDVDTIREKLVSKYSNNWRVLSAVAKSYQDSDYRYGFLLAGKFSRVSFPDSQQVSTDMRDRVHAIQLMLQAEKNIKNATGREIGKFYLYFADIFYNNRYNKSYAFSSLLNVNKLPEYDEIFSQPDYHENEYRYRRNSSGIVDEPVFYAVPSSWESAKNNGERWRWLLKKAASVDGESADDADYKFAQYVYEQYRNRYGNNYDRFKKKSDSYKDSIYNPKNLKDDEILIKYKSGIKKIKLPDEYNYIRLYTVLAESNGVHRMDANRILSQIYTEREQYKKVVECIKRGGVDIDINNFTGNTGEIYALSSIVTGKNSEVKYRFRNGKEVHFTASPINMEKILTVMKKDNFFKNYSDNLLGAITATLIYPEHQERDLEASKKIKEFIGTPVAEWDQSLSPKPDYEDSSVDVKIPELKTGTYLVTSIMKDGNTSSTIIMVVDTAIIVKPVKNAALLYVVDAVTGKALGNTEISFIGYKRKMRWDGDDDGMIKKDDKKNEDEADKYAAFEREFTTDDKGQLIIAAGSVDFQWIINAFGGMNDRSYTDLSWIVTARNGSRFTFMPFTVFNQSPWNSTRNGRNTKNTMQKSFAVADRPVYRPGDTVKFKAWINNIDYTKERANSFAGKQVKVKVFSPDRRIVVFTKTMTVDNFGGIADQFILDKDADEGSYNIEIEYNNQQQLFSVKEKSCSGINIDIQAEKTVNIGEKTTIKINVKQSDGKPAKNAKVNYKIINYSDKKKWRQPREWDWLYGNNYGSFSYDYDWYPGWEKWGDPQPGKAYNNINSILNYPELVATEEVLTGPDGAIDLSIDTSPLSDYAENNNYKYLIVATVSDDTEGNAYSLFQITAVRKPFIVNTRVDKGYYNTGDKILVNFNTYDAAGNAVKRKGEIKLYKIKWEDNKLTETPVLTEQAETNDKGLGTLPLIAGQGGQYRVSYIVKDNKDLPVEGSCIFFVYGNEVKTSECRFNGLEIIPDKTEYCPGDNVNLLINTNVPDSDVLLFIRSVNDVNPHPRIIKMKGKSTIVPIPVTAKDYPNFFVEAVTAGNGEIYDEVREIIVPPVKKKLIIEITPQNTTFKPGELTTVKLKINDLDGKPVSGQIVAAVYNKASDDISGEKPSTDIKKIFLNDRNMHSPFGQFNLTEYNNINYYRPYSRFFNFHNTDYYEMYLKKNMKKIPVSRENYGNEYMPENNLQIDEMRPVDYFRNIDHYTYSMLTNAANYSGDSMKYIADTRSNIHDTAFWSDSLKSGADGTAEFSFKIPDNFTGWSLKCWAMGDNGAVGQAETSSVKSLLVTLHAPSGMVAGDETVVIADIYNHQSVAKKVAIKINPDDVNIISSDVNSADIDIPANGMKQIYYKVKAVKPGNGVIKVITGNGDESDCTDITIPIHNNGTKNYTAYSGMIRPENKNGGMTINIPAGSIPGQSRLAIHWSPVIAGVMAESLTSLEDDTFDYAEADLKQIIPAVITRNRMKAIGIKLEDINSKRKKADDNSDSDNLSYGMLFSDDEVNQMIDYGVNQIIQQQHNDGSWNTYKTYYNPGTRYHTVKVMHSLLMIKGYYMESDFRQSFKRGLDKLKKYQKVEMEKLKMWGKGKKDVEVKAKADFLDAFTCMLLSKRGVDSKEMRQHLYKDRNSLPLCGKLMLAITLHYAKDIKNRNTVIAEIEKYLVINAAEKTARLQMPVSENRQKWCGGEFELQAFYLELLVLTEPKSAKTANVARYLLANRKNGTYWGSSRDTLFVIKALADYLKVNKDIMPDMDIQVMVDNRLVKTVKLNQKNLFTDDNLLTVDVAGLSAGKHTVKFIKSGTGALYFNAVVTSYSNNAANNAGQNIKISRKYYKMIRKNVDADDNNDEDFDRILIDKDTELNIGDLVQAEIELIADKDYESVVITDTICGGMKYKQPAATRINRYSGYRYDYNNMPVTREPVQYSDNEVNITINSLKKGTAIYKYSMVTANTGNFSQMPAKAGTIYNPGQSVYTDKWSFKIK